jgi:hypothetical protein
MRSTDDPLLMVLDKNVVGTLGLGIKMTYFQFSEVSGNCWNYVSAKSIFLRLIHDNSVSDDLPHLQADDSHTFYLYSLTDCHKKFTCQIKWTQNNHTHNNSQLPLHIFTHWMMITHQLQQSNYVCSTKYNTQLMSLLQEFSRPMFAHRIHKLKCV